MFGLLLLFIILAFTRVHVTSRHRKVLRVFILLSILTDGIEILKRLDICLKLPTKRCEGIHRFDGLTVDREVLHSSRVHFELRSDQFQELRIGHVCGLIDQIVLSEIILIDLHLFIF